MISKPTLGLDDPNLLFQYDLKSKKISSVKFHFNNIPIRLINFRHLQARNIEALQRFPKNKGSGDDIKNIIKACRNSDCVKELTLPWQMNASLKAQASKGPLLSETIKYLSSLQILNINGDFMDREIQQLKQGLKRLKTLKAFSLKSSALFSVRTSNKSLASLGKALRRLTFIEDLDLDFPADGISDLGIIELSKGLKKCRFLKRLRLIFASVRSKNSISDEGLDGICEAVRKLDCLQKLEIGFSEFFSREESMEIGLKNLSESLKGLQELKSLTLTFVGRQSITDTDLEYLGEALTGLRLLNDVTLCFEKCENITDVGFEEVCKEMGKLEFLRDLTILFNGCRGITDEGLERFGEIVGEIGGLESLDFDFRRCGRISVSGLEGLKEGLMKLTQIKSVYLDFNASSNMEKDQVERIKDELKSHPGISLLTMP